MTAGAAMHLTCFMQDETRYVQHTAHPDPLGLASPQPVPSLELRRLVLVAEKKAKRYIPPWIHTTMVPPPVGASYMAPEWELPTELIAARVYEAVRSSVK